ncbi:MAG: hypothetical protein PHV32_15570 [Eubacteriales bacterium]|nr:hypothetical protein [Eubacteriales bacterium]
MSLSVNLWSTSAIELENFLKSFYDLNESITGGAKQWFHEYPSPLESVDMISAVMDNSDKYQIVMYLQFGSGDLFRITNENYNDVIKGLYMHYYHECLNSR